MGEVISQASQKAGLQEVRNEDRVRQLAVWQLLEQLYPDITHGQEARLARQARSTRAEGRVLGKTEAPIEAAAETARERPSISEISFIHIEDDVFQQDSLANILKDRLGMEQRLGVAASVEGAKELIQKLIRENKLPKLILLDKSFFQDEGDDTADSRA